MNELLEKLNASRLAAYRACPRDILEHAGKEESVSAGGYGYRQILELVQNGADAILEAYQNGMPNTQPRIEVRLSGSRLYVANTGAPLSEKGVEALLSSDLSPKRGNQIGRFGLGFKSLLRLGGVIDVFTKTAGNIRFDPSKCRRELRDAFSVPAAPGLRLAWPLDNGVRGTDPVLQSLDWAETIVCAEVCVAGLREHLISEIRDFPREFLLFLDHPAEISLYADEGKPVILRVENQGEVKILHTQEEQIRWRVFSREVEVSEQEAVVDATSIHARKTVPLAWAAPLDAKREEAGRFWAFFPTHTPTCLPGILNAPWKLNSDRNSLVRGEWNNALMREAAKLVVENLSSLSSPDDPGRLLDAFPRQPERQDDDAVPMINAIWATFADAKIIPDAAGNLRSPRQLLRPPRDDQALAEKWQAIASDEQLARFVHSSCLDRLRSSRLNALAERLRSTPMTQGQLLPLARVQPAAWFEAVASAKTSVASAVLKLAAQYESAVSKQEWSQIASTLVVIPTEEGRLDSCDDVVFMPEGALAPEGRDTVAHALAALPEARDVLENTFGVAELDDTTWQTILSESLPASQFSSGWDDFWSILRAAPAAIGHRFLQQNSLRVHVRCRANAWQAASRVLLPGEIVRPDDNTQSTQVLVHSGTHANDSVRLALLGVTDSPALFATSRYFGELGEWVSYWRTHYHQNHNSSPRSEYLNPQGLALPIATSFLPLLTGPANARLTAKLLPILGSCPLTCKFGHDTSDKYPKVDVPHPLPWLLLRYGEIAVGDTTVTLRSYLERAPLCSAALASLPGISPSFTSTELARLQSVAQPLFKPTLKEIQALWIACIQAASTPERWGNDSLSSLCSAAAKDHVCISSVISSTGVVPITGIFVTGSPDLAARVRSPQRVVITLDEQALQLWQSNGARPLADLVKPEWDSVTGPDLRLVEVIPELSTVLTAKAGQEARCQAVSGLRLVVGETQESLPCLMWEDRLLIDLTQFRSLSQHRRFAALLHELAPTTWLAFTAPEALRFIADSTVEVKRATVAAAPNLPARLLAALDGHPEPLRSALGVMATQAFLEDCIPLQLAELVIAQQGPATLSNLRDALAEAGLQPPARWNTAEARSFVTSLGFPEIFAEASAARRDAEEIITGPIDLPPLHDFQKDVLDGVRTLLASGTGRRRAVVSLPTGGGKTRVTVQAAVTLVLAPPSERRSVIWIAQSDELCEQAVQAFRQVWLNLGAQRTDLRIVRLWGGNPNPATQELDKPLVVVASIQTLNARMGGASLEWLQQPGLVVVDECHHAITPSYTDLLRWLDAEAQRPGAPMKEEPPILGLSATPFRMDDDESRRLAARFGNLWFPADQADLHARLRAQGVLAAVDNEALESGACLTEDERQLFDLHSTQLEGIDFERLLEALNQRLAGLEERNQRIIECVQQASQRSILLFANSVNHAMELSARLNLLGIPSAAISSDTPRIARRYFLDKFQRGDLRVLCNHSILTTGFDAPRTDMLLIARQVFSPVRYMQIVGRGLRGEKNGGTARCRIVTVLDNLGRFQNRHPYHYCAGYFASASLEVSRSNSNFSERVSIR
jgi:superfamily II DNA or RNA helicase